MKSSSKKDEGGCAKCGTCCTVCPVYQVTGNEIFSPRGKQHLAAGLRKGKRSAHYAEIFSKCLLCGACYDVCPRGLDTPGLVGGVRAELPDLSGISFLKYVSRKALVHPGLLSGLARAGSAANVLLGDLLPEESGLRLRLAGFSSGGLSLPEKSYLAGLKNEPESHAMVREVNYFTGCLANLLQPEIARSTQYLTAKVTGSEAAVPLRQTCCGMAAIASGKPDEAAELARRNIRAFEDNDLPILTSCSSCYFQLLGYRELFADDPLWQGRAARFTDRVREFSTFFLERFSQNPEAKAGTAVSPGRKVYYHDPCHLRFKLHITREPRQLLGLFPGAEPAEIPGGSKCCGHGGLFQVAHPDLARQIREKMGADIGSGTVVTACSGCLLQWQSGLLACGSRAGAQHLAVFIAGLFE